MTRPFERLLRDPSTVLSARTLLVLILTGAGLLRVWGLTQGIPFAVGIDEPQIMDRAVRMMKTGDFNPHFFDYPSLYIYIQLIVAIVRFVTGAVAGKWGSLTQVSAADFYLWGRMVTAALGTATVWLVYRAGLRWGGVTAVVAALLMAIMPMHVRESHYVLTDVPQTFFVTAVLVLSLRAAATGTLIRYAAAGAVAGLAAATKYTGAPALILPLLACWTVASSPRSRALVTLAVVASFGAAFLMAAPYTLLDLPGFLEGFAHLSTSYTGALPAQAPAVTYLKHLRNNLGLGAALLTCAGIVFALARLVRGPDRTRWALLIVFPLVYVWFISRQSLVYARYLLPAIPFLSILGAVTLVAVFDVLRRVVMPRAARAALITALLLLAVAQPLYRAVTFDRDLARTWTTELAYEWIRSHAPAGANVAVETSFLMLPPPFHPEYVTRITAKSYDQYAAEGVKYLVLTSEVFGRYVDSRAPQGEHLDYVRLFREAPEAARFVPSKDHPGPEVRILEVHR